MHPSNEIFKDFIIQECRSDLISIPSSKYRHYDYAYNGRQGGVIGDVASASRGGVAQTPVAQKKHQMFGKRVFHDQNDMTAGSPAMPSPSQGHKFDYSASGAAAAAAPLYSHPPTPLDGNSSMHSMDMKYGCPMDYNHHPQGKTSKQKKTLRIIAFGLHLYHY